MQLWPMGCEQKYVHFQIFPEKQDLHSPILFPLPAGWDTGMGLSHLGPCVGG
jgi:hypothetical protein